MLTYDILAQRLGVVKRMQGGEYAFHGFLEPIRGHSLCYGPQSVVCDGLGWAGVYRDLARTALLLLSWASLLRKEAIRSWGHVRYCRQTWSPPTLILLVAKLDHSMAA